MAAIVGLTAAVDAQAAIFDRLKAEADGGLLNDWQIDDAYRALDPQPGAVQKQMYGGGWRSAQEDAVAEHGLLMNETIAVSLYLCVIAPLPTATPASVKAMVKAGGVVIGQIFKNNPRLAGDLTWLGITTGAGDCYPLDDQIMATHSFALQVGARLVWGI
jgi:hypothetical protein